MKNNKQDAALRGGHLGSRRAILKSLGAAGLVTAASGLVLPAHVLAQLTDDKPEAQPRQGGRIRVATNSSSTRDTLDPAKASLSTDYVRMYMVYSGLTQFNRELGADLALAETIESDNQQDWHITLRSGVTFHDGKSLTPQDVVYSLMRHKDPDVTSRVAPIAAQFEEVVVTGERSLRIMLKAPNADLPVMLASSNFCVVADGTTDFSRTANGTGPYQLKEFSAGVRTIGVRNPNFWKPGKPYLDEIELVGIADESSRVNALLSGDIQMVLAVDPRSTKRVKRSGTCDVMQTESSLYTNLVMRQDAYPTNNPDFVMAIKYMTDRELIKRALFRGYATIANDHPVAPSHKYFHHELPQRPYDIDRAKFHLKKAGMNGLRVPIFASPVATGSVDMAALMQLSGIEAGVHLGINRVPADGYWSNHWMKHPLGFGNINPRVSLDELFSLFFKSDAPWNESGWQNQQFDQLLLAARGEGDDAKRKQMYWDMQELIHQHCGIGIPVFMNLIDGYDKRVKGIFPIPTGGLMGYSFAEHVWLDA
ncbi:ABC transporter substrate-binding protein [Paraglaciecola chathamensis]|uniref:ABC transporter substrate-binding protein n=1 Tax=Paraglaciecola chathamensis TaxID=368405 RepID=UPI000A0021A7|nr:ABC transporter substrate-binding protein [Paraglaciecola chathamensis]